MMTGMARKKPSTAASNPAATPRDIASATPSKVPSAAEATPAIRLIANVSAAPPNGPSGGAPHQVAQVIVNYAEIHLNALPAVYAVGATCPSLPAAR